MKRWSPLVHQIYRDWRESGLFNQQKTKLGLAVSGGADSVALAHVIHDLQRVFQLKPVVLHVHHGSGDNEVHRDKAQQLVVELAKQLAWPCVCNRSEEFLKSEQELRIFRRNIMLSEAKKYGLAWIVTGHHSQDLLETRVMRLIRGTGPRGLPAISKIKKPFLRPFLDQSPAELRRELLFRKAKFIEDPSNQDQRYFRNWVRHEWLPLLECKKPGSLLRMAKSLGLLSEIVEPMPSPIPKGVSRAEFTVMPMSQRRSLVAKVLWTLKKSNYSQNHVNEVIKRLDIARVEHSFTVLGLRWVVSAREINWGRNTRPQAKG